MTNLTLSLLLQVSILGAGPQAKAEDYAHAYKAASTNGQPIMVLVGADWCPACVTMKSAVIPEIRRRGSLEKVAFATVNTDRQSTLANQLMTGGGIPQLIMFYKGENGWKRMQINGSVSAETVESLINRGVAATTAAKTKTTTAANSTPAKPIAATVEATR
jgi:thioredoxin-like negative regulator of GroEL